MCREQLAVEENKKPAVELRGKNGNLRKSWKKQKNPGESPPNFAEPDASDNVHDRSFLVVFSVVLLFQNRQPIRYFHFDLGSRIDQNMRDKWCPALMQKLIQAHPGMLLHNSLKWLKIAGFFKRFMWFWTG